MLTIDPEVFNSWGTIETSSVESKIPKMDAALDQIQQLATNADELTRRQLMNSLHKLAYSMESPQETIHRYGHSVSLQAETSNTEANTVW
jgi:hypothetical protein